MVSLRLRSAENTIKQPMRANKPLIAMPPNAPIAASVRPLTELAFLEKNALAQMMKKILEKPIKIMPKRNSE